MSSLRFLILAPFAVWAATWGACSSSDNGGGDAGTDGSSADAFTICIIDQFLDAGGSGGPCPFASPERCFPECTTGGCYCKTGPNGPTWSCTSDHSCEPDGMPPIDLDAMPDGETTTDAGSDAAPDAPAAEAAGPDASADVVEEASVDAGEGGASDASSD